VARAATATLSADARSRVVLLAFFISGSNPQESAWDGNADDEWTVSGCDPDHQ
jgi:hypothetical protein